MMAQNIEKVIQRGERLDDLVDKTDELNAAVSRGTELGVERNPVPSVTFLKHHDPNRILRKLSRGGKDWTIG